MENLAYKETEVYAVINRNDQVMDIFEDYNEAMQFAEFYNAMSVERLEKFNGFEGTVKETIMLSEIGEKDMLKQKIYAIFLIILTVAMIPITMDATFALFMIPIMICMLCSKKYWIIDWGGASLFFFVFTERFSFWKFDFSVGWCTQILVLENVELLLILATEKILKIIQNKYWHSGKMELSSNHSK